jgi:hypothetical protein
LKVEFFDLSFRTAYAQAKELALSQHSVPILTAGSLQTEPRGGHLFVYRYRYGPGGKRVTEYLGPDGDPKTDEKVEEAEAEIRESSLLSEYSRNLRRIGFHGTDNSAMVTVAALFNAGIFSSGGVLVGTHAFGAILNELGVASGPLAMTEDVDIARAARIKLATHVQPDFLRLLSETGLPFLPVPQLERGEPPTSFKVRGQRLKVDLLVPARGEPYHTVPLPELGAHATAIPHLKYLLEGSTHSILMGRDRIVPVAIPDAGRYCMHKLAVYSLRASNNSKRRKDLQQAALLAAAMTHDQDFKLRDAIDAMSASLRRIARAGARDAAGLLAENHAEAADALSAMG